MSFKPRTREVFSGYNDRNSLGSVDRTYGDNRFSAVVYNRVPTAPANRFTEIGITNNNILNCGDPNWVRSTLTYGSQTRTGFHPNVKATDQRNDYQKGANTWGYAPGTPLMSRTYDC